MEWGPYMWVVLHTCAEHLGKPRHPINQTDEVNTWILLLKSVEFALPCAMCKGHYHAWLQQHPVSQFQTMRGTTLRENARKWVYRLHEEVNGRKGVASGITLEQMPDLYTDLTAFQKNIEKLVALLKEAVQFGRVTMEGTFTFRKHLHYFRKITDSI